MSIQFFAPRGADKQIVQLPTSLRRTVKWLPKIGDLFPNFTVETTQGRLRFWDWAEGHWIHLFSHPAAFTPVCTTEIASIASFDAAWQAADVRNLALTGSPIEDQHLWHEEIESIFGQEVRFPCAYDRDLQLSHLFGMIHEKESEAWPIRKSFLIDPSLHLRMIFEYPVFVGRRTDEVLRVVKAMQLRDKTGVATPSDWEDGDPVIIPDERPETELVEEFGALSNRLSSYLRLVHPAR